jgi:DNA-binding response OmpR family regulator
MPLPSFSIVEPKVPSTATAAPALLWVDADVEDSCRSVQLLRSHGLQVACVHSASDALTQLRASLFDALILDLSLPDLNGLTVLERVRCEHPQTPVVVVTAQPSLEISASALRLGAINVLTKPLSTESLLRAVADLLGSDPGGTASDDRPDFPESRVLAMLFDTLERAETEDAGGGRRALSGLSAALHHRAVSIPSFLACAEGFRIAAAEDPGIHVLQRVKRAVVEALAATSYPRRDKTLRVVSALDRAVRVGVHPKVYEIADSLAIDPAHLGRMLKLDTGLTYSQWRIGTALRRALRPLIETHSPIDAVSLSCGYQHTSQFVREFARIFGVTPGGYRKLCEPAPRWRRALPLIDDGELNLPDTSPPRRPVGRA